MRLDYFVVFLLLLVLGALLLVGCTTVVEPLPPVVVQPSPPPKVVVKPRPMIDRDISAEIVLRCDQLRLTGPGEHRLCLLRGMDRYLGHDTEPYLSQFSRRDDIQIVQPPPAPPSAPIVAPPPRNSSRLVLCSVDPTPPCVLKMGPPYEESRQ